MKKPYVPYYERPAENPNASDPERLHEIWKIEDCAVVRCTYGQLYAIVRPRDCGLRYLPLYSSDVREVLFVHFVRRYHHYPSDASYNQFLRQVASFATGPVHVYRNSAADGDYEAPSA